MSWRENLLKINAEAVKHPKTLAARLSQQFIWDIITTVKSDVVVNKSERLRTGNEPQTRTLPKNTIDIWDELEPKF